MSIKINNPSERTDLFHFFVWAMVMTPWRFHRLIGNCSHLLLKTSINWIVLNIRVTSLSKKVFRKPPMEVKFTYCFQSIIHRIHQLTSQKTIIINLPFGKNKIEKNSKIINCVLKSKGWQIIRWCYFDYMKCTRFSVLFYSVKTINRDEFGRFSLMEKIWFWWNGKIS